MSTSAYAAYEQKKINLINDLIAQFSGNSDAVALGKETSNLFRNRKAPQKKIDVRHLNQVIHIDTENMIATVEGMTPYAALVDAALAHNCLPAVVPELKSITVGGALAGVGIESSSFRYGLAHETMTEYEILLADGRTVTCRPDNEYRDLYYAFPNSYGTLGYALKVCVKLIPAKKYIKLTHRHFTDPVKYFATMQQYCQENRTSGLNSGKADYIEGVVFDKNDMYITTAQFVDTAPMVSNYKYMNIYYQSIKNKHTDYLTSYDYIWRWDTDWFWCSKHFYMQHYIPRLLLGKFMLNSINFWKVRSFINRNPWAKKLVALTQGKNESVIQDIEVPVENAAKFLDFFQKEIGVKPVWICPTKPYNQNVLYDFYKMDPEKLYINFGFWDVVPTKQPDGFYNRKIERMVQDLGGNKSLYSNVFYTEDEFWQIYNKDLYFTLKQKYDPNSKLRNIYQKCSERN